MQRETFCIDVGFNLFNVTQNSAARSLAAQVATDNSSDNQGIVKRCGGFVLANWMG